MTTPLAVEEVVGTARMGVGVAMVEEVAASVEEVEASAVVEVEVVTAWALLVPNSARSPGISKPSLNSKRSVLRISR